MTLVRRTAARSLILTSNAFSADARAEAALDLPPPPAEEEEREEDEEEEEDEEDEEEEEEEEEEEDMPCVRASEGSLAPALAAAVSAAAAAGLSALNVSPSEREKRAMFSAKRRQVVVSLVSSRSSAGEVRRHSFRHVSSRSRWRERTSSTERIVLAWWP